MSASFEYYRIFYYVTKHGSFTKAAKVLLTSQPAITRAMHNLENELGCCLFIRGKNGVELTPEGKHLYEYVSVGCEQFLKGENELAESVSLQNGTVYLGATETALHCYLFEILEEFNQEYPNVHFKIANYTTNEAISALKNGSVDFAIVSSPLKISKPLVTQKVKSFQDILIGGKKYAHLSNTQISIHDLVNYPFVCLASGTTTRTFMEKVFQNYNLQLLPDIEPATTDLILPTIKHNLGLGFIPFDMVQEDLQAQTIYRIKTLEAIPKREICLVYDSTHPQSIASRALQSFIQNQLKL